MCSLQLLRACCSNSYRTTMNLWLWHGYKRETCHSRFIIGQCTVFHPWGKIGNCLIYYSPPRGVLVNWSIYHFPPLIYCFPPPIYHFPPWTQIYCFPPPIYHFPPDLLKPPRFTIFPFLDEQAPGITLLWGCCFHSTRVCTQGTSSISIHDVTFKQRLNPISHEDHKKLMV